MYYPVPELVLDVDIATAAKEVVAQIERLPEVLAHGSVAEVKNVLRGFVATVEYNPEMRKARVGFYPLERTEPARAILGFNAPESARISMVAGARYEPATVEHEGSSSAAQEKTPEKEL